MDNNSTLESSCCLTQSARFLIGCVQGINRLNITGDCLAALVPKPRVNLARFHGVFAPNSLHRVWVTPARRGKGSPKLAADQDEKTPAQRHVAMTWAQRLKRVFNIDVETCRACGAAAKVIACIEDPVVIRKILNHLQEKSALDSGVHIPNSHAPPQALSGEFLMLNEWPVLAECGS